MAVFIALSSFIFFPLNYYSHFYLEHKYDLSNQSFLHWILDGVKSFLLNLIFSLIIVEAVYFLLRELPNTWWIWSTIFYFFLTVVISRITPTIILPLFYKVKLVENDSLVNRLKSLAEKARAKVLGVYQMDMSRKTKKANAMFTGLGKSKRIILGDTLLERFREDEIETILAHELGHYYYRHLWQLILMGLGTSLAGFYIVNIVLKMLVEPLSLGGLHNIAGLPVFMLVVFLFFLILMPFQNSFSRILEKQADRFAIEQTKNPQAFIDSMKKLADQNLSEVKPHPVVEFILYSHPSIDRRIKFAQKYLS